MLAANEVSALLGYSDSTNWVVESEVQPVPTHLRRRAREAGVFGTYLFRTSPENDPLLPPKSVVHVAEARNVEQARELHRKLWNLGDAPFLIVVLPHQIRVYTNFQFDPSEDRPLLEVNGESQIHVVAAALSAFHADQIDSGKLWDVWGSRLPMSGRVDQKLLNDLSDLGKVLVEVHGLKPATAHSLIGKYIYIRYLWDREILSEKWLTEHSIRKDEVLGPHANRATLHRLVDALEDRFNGRVFPLPLSGHGAPSDRDVAFIASVFRGDSPSGQLALDFRIYDFFYIPIELLSSIYEQFLHAEGKGRKAGAYYTPEPLAEYLLSEVNAAVPLRRGHRVLDPCCGSGVFLVLAYRRLIEHELASQGGERLRPSELRQILTDSIFGIERNPEACYVTEFSLILTMLSYIDPPELHRNKQFKFPALHGKNIVQADFFDLESRNQAMHERFDWVIGNPPWVELDPTSAEERYAIEWITSSARSHPVARYRVSEAFAWLAPSLLKREGVVGFVLHAKSLSNELSFAFRKHFFKEHVVVRVTNFSNLVRALFEGRVDAPAITMVYRRVDDADVTSADDAILHYAPFAVNQVPVRSLASKRSWTITIFENEIGSVDRQSAASGSAEPWKIALWGNYRDQSTLARLRKLFPTTVEQLCRTQGWHFGLGVQLRSEADARAGDVEEVPGLIGQWVLKSEIMNRLNHQFEVPQEALIRNADPCLRKRGGKRGLALMRAPHVVITPKYAAYSDVDFIVEHPRVGISGPAKDADHLRALSLYLNSNIARYLAFFSSTRWGIDRITSGYVDVAGIRVPTFTPEQIRDLAGLHVRSSEREGADTTPNLFSQDQDFTASDLTESIVKIMGIPGHIAFIVDEFVEVRLKLNNGKTGGVPLRHPDTVELTSYATSLREQLESYSQIPHRVSILTIRDFIVCEVEPNPTMRKREEPVIKPAASDVHSKLWALLRTSRSQWVYVQRSLRVFDGNKLYIFKPNRLLDWTRTQALLDSDDIINEVLASIGRQP